MGATRRIAVAAAFGLAAVGWLLAEAPQIGGTGQVAEVLLTVAVVWPVATVGGLVALAAALPRGAES